MDNKTYRLYIAALITVAVIVQGWMIVFLDLSPISTFALLLAASVVIVYYTRDLTRKSFEKSTESLDVSDTNFDKFVKDELTQIYNQEKFRDIINLEMQRMRILKTSSSSIIFDIDNFEELNSRLGRDSGDKILIGLVQIIKSLIRDSDIFARVVGDSFMILLPNTSIENAYTLAERIRITVEESEMVENEAVTCSFGVVALTSSMNEDTLLDLAKEKLKIAKQMGKNTVV